uniref:Uncharacterized protein n=1 Tax=Populus trichocarpa TaxID=3694 RepID=B9GS04_POPTR
MLAVSFTVKAAMFAARRRRKIFTACWCSCRQELIDEELLTMTGLEWHFGCSLLWRMKLLLTKLLVWLEGAYGAAAAEENHDYEEECFWCCCDGETFMAAVERSFIATAEDYAARMVCCFCCATEERATDGADHGGTKDVECRGWLCMVEEKG